MEKPKTHEGYWPPITEQIRWIDLDIEGWKNEVKRCEGELEAAYEKKKKLLIEAGLT